MVTNDKPDSKPVSYDSEFVPQHKRLASGAPVNGGASSGGGKKPKS